MPLTRYNSNFAEAVCYANVKNTNIFNGRKQIELFLSKINYQLFEL
jgi:hypothetical protein